MQIEKRDYSSNPWRLVDDRGEEIYIPQEIDHPTMGRQTINMPFCAETKSQLVYKVLELLEKMNELRRKQAAEILELKNEITRLRSQVLELIQDRNDLASVVVDLTEDWTVGDKEVRRRAIGLVSKANGYIASEASGNVATQE